MISLALSRRLTVRKLFLPLLVVTISLSIALFTPVIPKVYAAGSLTIQPQSQPTAANGSTVKYNVTVQNIPNADFAGWDIYVTVDSSILNPTTITLCNASACNVPYSNSGGGNFMPAGTDAQCINGIFAGGAFNPCTGLDGPGIVHDSFSSSGFTTGSLLLFTVTYSVVASGQAAVAFPESTTGATSQNHLFDSNAFDIIVSEIGGTYGSAAPSLVSVVTGTDGNLYWSPFTGSWQTWQPLNGQSSSPPSLCQSGPSSTELVVRGTDNGIYHKTFSGGTFSAAWDRNPTGVTIDQPVCAVIGATLYVVVRGATNEIWSTTFDLSAHTWAASWTDLLGFSPSAPALAATSAASRLDLVVRGVDNQIYHKAFTSGAWAAQWDTSNRLPVPDKTIGTPAIVSDGTTLHIVVIGTEANIWYATRTFAGVWSTYTSLTGSTPVTPTLVVDSTGALHLIVQGQDRAVYSKAKPSGGAWDAAWTSAGGQTAGTPAAVVLGSTVHVVARGFDSRLWYNTLAGATWSGWTSMNGAASIAPGLSPP